MPELQAKVATAKYCSRRLIFGKESHFIKSHIGKKVGFNPTKRGEHDHPTGQIFNKKNIQFKGTADLILKVH